MCAHLNATCFAAILLAFRIVLPCKVPVKVSWYCLIDVFAMHSCSSCWYDLSFACLERIFVIDSVTADGVEVYICRCMFGMLF
uniref:Putative secreted protein n=1 Tax=Ixodes ricinus TaxID=34613 RepID=A0A6B0TXJ0_IXORI